LVHLAVRLFSGLFLTTLFMGCGITSHLGGETQIAITPTRHTMTVGVEQLYTAQTVSANGATSDITSKVSWVSSNTAVASFVKVGSGNALVAVAPGKTTITATSASTKMSGSATLIVTAAPVRAISVNAARQTVEAGYKQPLTATGTLTNGLSLELTHGVVWASSDPSIAKVDDAGFVTTLAPGLVTISGVSGKITGAIPLTVTPPELTEMRMVTAVSSLASGLTHPFSVEGSFTDGVTRSLTKGVIWRSSDPAIVTINEEGVAAAVAKDVSSPLSVTLTATSEKMSVSAKLTVTPPVLREIRVSPAIPFVAVGLTQTFLAEGTFTDGVARPLTKGITWSTSDALSASISGNGTVTAVAKNLKSSVAITITAAIADISGTAKLTVTPPELTAIRITPDKPSVIAGLTQPFTAEGAFTDGVIRSVDSGLVWTSSNPFAVIVNEGGLANAIAKEVMKPLPVTITVASGKITSTTTLMVTPAELTDLMVAPAIPFVAAGLTQPFLVEGTFTNGLTRTLMTGITWSSSDPTTVTVNSDGVAMAIAKGVTSPRTVKITATAGKISRVVKLTVTPPTLTELRVTPVIPFVIAGQTQQFSAEGSFTDGVTQTMTKEVTWSSSDPASVTISSNGLATAVGKEMAQPVAVKITAASGNMAGTAKLTITPPELVSIRVMPDRAQMVAGRAQLFTAEGSFTDGVTRPLTANVIWSSSDEAVVDVDLESGFVTAKASGTATLTARSGKISGLGKLTVIAAELTEIIVTPKIPFVAVGRTQQFSAEGTFTDGTTRPLTKGIKWNSSDTSAVKISNDGLATAVAKEVGSPIAIKVTAILGTVSGTAKLTVTPPELMEIRVTPATPSLAAGQTQVFTAEGIFTDGARRPIGSQVQWEMSDPVAVTIDSSGRATAVAKGVTGPFTVTVAAVSEKVRGTAALTITPPELTAIRITPDKPSVIAGRTQSFTAEGAFTDGVNRPLTKEVAWSSSNNAMATVGLDGLATAVAKKVVSPMEVEIAASSGKLRGTTRLVITPPELTAIRVHPDKPSVVAGRNQPFSAEGTFSDGTTRSLTSGVAWVSSNTSVATIDSKSGLVSTLAEGGVTLTAAFEKVTGTASLLVSPPDYVAIHVTPGETSAVAGRSQQFVAEGAFTDGITRPLIAGVVWTSSNSSVVVIDKDSGLAAAKSAGKATITATTVRLNSTANITITPAELTHLRITPMSSVIAAGQLQLFLAEGTFTDGVKRAMTKEVKWSSSDTSIVTITQEGRATAVAKGVTMPLIIKITASVGAISERTEIGIIPPELTELRITPSQASIAAGQTRSFSAEGSFTDGVTQLLTKTVTWSSSDPGVVTIDRNGVVSVVAKEIKQPISVQITAASGKLNRVVPLTVSQAELVAIAVSPHKPVVAAGRTQVFSAGGSFTDGVIRPLVSGITWSSSDPSTIHINENGQATVIAKGVTAPLSVQITAASGKVSGSVSLTVTPPELTGIQIRPSNPSVASGKIQQFTVKGTFTDGVERDITSNLIWSSSDISVASIDSDGLVTSAGRGVEDPLTVRITVMSGAMSGTTKLTVTPPQEN
jgi:uncharacterized protein YjdB